MADIQMIRQAGGSSRGVLGSEGFKLLDVFGIELLTSPDSARRSGTRCSATCHRALQRAAHSRTDSAKGGAASKAT